jgi:hypothetical protein
MAARVAGPTSAAPSRYRWRGCGTVARRPPTASRPSPSRPAPVGQRTGPRKEERIGFMTAMGEGLPRPRRSHPPGPPARRPSIWAAGWCSPSSSSSPRGRVSRGDLVPSTGSATSASSSARSPLGHCRAASVGRTLLWSNRRGPGDGPARCRRRHRGVAPSLGRPVRRGGVGATLQCDGGEPAPDAGESEPPRPGQRDLRVHRWGTSADRIAARRAHRAAPVPAAPEVAAACGILSAL